MRLQLLSNYLLPTFQMRNAQMKNAKKWGWTYRFRRVESKLLSTVPDLYASFFFPNPIISSPTRVPKIVGICACFSVSRLAALSLCFLILLPIFQAMMNSFSDFWLLGDILPRILARQPGGHVRLQHATGVAAMVVVVPICGFVSGNLSEAHDFEVDPEITCVFRFLRSVAGK